MISFVGAGPGAADLLTLRAVDRLNQAEVVVWASSLVSEDVLEHVPPGAAVHDSAGMTFEDVVAIYQAHPEARVVRLHSGDVSLYSAVQEQVDWCEANGRPWEVVPGVGSLAAASALLGRELTIPGVAQSVITTRLPGRTAASMPEGETVATFARHGTTLAVYLSAARPDELQAQLLAGGEGYPPDTPAALVIRASWPDERVHRTTVGQLAQTMRADGARVTALVLVGPALAAEAGRCRLYDPGYAHAHRRRSHPGSTEGRPTAPTRPGGEAGLDPSSGPVPATPAVLDARNDPSRGSVPATPAALVATNDASRGSVPATSAALHAGNDASRGFVPAAATDDRSDP